ncbi:MAG: hypothetical protein Q4A78_04865 [Peptostreptococcaceae bacterium]|nr:hypothetical protein [Peptostreptococcaceae bacterium]
MQVSKEDKDDEVNQRKYAVHNVYPWNCSFFGPQLMDFYEMFGKNIEKDQKEDRGVELLNGIGGC